MTDEDEKEIQDEHEKSDKPLHIGDFVPPPQMRDPLIPWRLEALKIAKDIALNLGHFKDVYESKEEFFEELDHMYEISDKNLKYLLGEK